MASQRNKRTSPYGNGPNNPGTGTTPTPLPKTMTASQRMSQMQGQNNRPNERASVPINEILNNPRAPQPFSQPGKPLSIPEAFSRLDRKISLVEEILESKGIEVEKSKVDKFTNLERKVDGVLKRFFTQEQLENHLGKTTFTKTQINFALENLSKSVKKNHALQSDLEVLRKMSVENDEKVLELERKYDELNEKLELLTNAKSEGFLENSQEMGSTDLASTTALVDDEDIDDFTESSEVVDDSLVSQEKEEVVEDKQEEIESDETIERSIEVSTSQVSLESISSPKIIGDLSYQQEIEMEIKEKTVTIEEEKKIEEVKEIVQEVVEDVVDSSKDKPQD